MKSLRSSGKPKRLKPGIRRTGILLVRRVAGDSMSPAIPPGKIVVGAMRFRKLHEGDVVIVLHKDLEKIKRVVEIRGDQLFVVGDNSKKSTDSRSFGWLSVALVRAKVIWPRRACLRARQDQA